MADRGSIGGDLGRIATSVGRPRLSFERINMAARRRVSSRRPKKALIDAIRMLHDIASMANHVQNASQALEHCLQRLATYDGWSFGHALLPAADSPDELVPWYICYPQDSERFRRFREVTLGMRFRRDEDLPGRAFASGQPEWTTDLRRDLVACRAVVAEELGLGTAIAFPVPVGEKIAGVLEFFSDRIIQPDRRTIDTMVDVGLQLGRVLERASFAEHLLTMHYRAGLIGGKLEVGATSRGGTQVVCRLLPQKCEFNA